MIFPKPLMSITELTGYGFSRTHLVQLSNVEDAPTFRTPAGGKILFQTEHFMEFVNEVEKRRKKAGGKLKC